MAESAADRARELDREFEITQRWRTFSLDFRRNLPGVYDLLQPLCLYDAIYFASDNLGF